MSESETTDNLDFKSMTIRFAVMVAVSLGAGMIGHYSGALEFKQAVACGVFLAIIMGTLFFWNFRLAIAFLGLSVLIFTNSLNIARFVTSSSLEVILFLVGMMIIVGALRDLGFFTWVVQLIVSMPNISGKKFIACTAFASALLACAVDEVTSIIFVSTLIFQVCDRLKLNPLPYVMICVLATNVGSAGTMMGNPVGIFIGTKAGLTFGDFMIWAFPLMILALLATIAVTMLYFHKDLKLFDAHLRDRLAKNLSLAPVVEVPYKRGLFLLAATVGVIASHHPLEQMFGLEKNSILLIAPLICSGIVMIIKHNRARYYVEHEVDWWTLVFFMLLFAVAGTVQFTGVDKVMASGFIRVCGTGQAALVPFILSVSAVGSAFVDNVIFVAAFSPVIEQLSQTMKDMPLWLALLFGACLGGNITMIGSTANIVALGMLERKSHVHVNFLHWLKIGFLSALVATLIAWAGIMALSPLMPDRYSILSSAAFDAGSDLEFNNKKVTVIGRADGGRLKLESEHQQYAVGLAADGIEIPSGLRAYRGIMNGDPRTGYTLTVEDVFAKEDANAH